MKGEEGVERDFCQTHDERNPIKGNVSQFYFKSFFIIPIPSTVKVDCGGDDRLYTAWCTAAC